MALNICRGCQLSLSENNGKKIFDDDTLIKSIDFDGHYDQKWSMKLYSGIELITGQKVTREEKLPEKMCDVCFKKIETYVNFRFQLLKSQEILLHSSHSNQDARVSSDFKSHEIKTSVLLSSTTCRPVTNELNRNSLEPITIQKDFSSSPLISKSITPNSPPLKVVSEDLINVDDSNVSLDVNTLNNEDSETNDFLTCKLQNDQENNNPNESDSSADNIMLTNIEDVAVKHHDHDIESEIDVCSGEDDEVLVLDIEKAKNETVEISSTSESDIDVCDYEPPGKRGNYNSLSPPIRF